jgi:hypothetical protein
MREYKNYLIFGGFVVLFLILLNFRNGEISSLVEMEKEISSIEADGVVLEDLRKRWDNKREYDKIIGQIKNFSPRPKMKTKGDKIFFTFEESMDRRKFEQLAGLVLKSTVKIQKVEVERVDDYTVTMFLEVEK